MTLLRGYFESSAVALEDARFKWPPAWPPPCSLAGGGALNSKASAGAPARRGEKQQDGGTGMSEALVPDGGIDGGGEAVAWRRQRIEVAGGVTSEKHRLGGQILNRKAIGVKFD